MLLLTAVVIGVISHYYTGTLVNHLQEEERRRVELWAKATEALISSPETEKSDFEVIAMILEMNTTIPLLLTDSEGVIISTANYPERRAKDTTLFYKELQRIAERSDPIVIDLGDEVFNYIYYKDSIILRKIRYFPIIQLSAIAIFLLVSYLAFSSSRRAEQNQVWVGMSKETAHQLGTPVSSLSAWIDIIREKEGNDALAGEMERDVERLIKITERFSGIGSKPEMQETSLTDVIKGTVEYLKSRVSSKVEFKIESDTKNSSTVHINSELIEWVLENILKNSIDAMEGNGIITIRTGRQGKYHLIDISDTGKGIPKRVHKTVFKPGYTTKSSGWGLGLSLAKRIIEEYHKGKIFVRSSEPGKGSTIRIMLMRY